MTDTASRDIVTPEGLDHFYAIFEDYENMGDETRQPSQFLYQGLTPLGAQKGKNKETQEEKRKDEYRAWLRDTVSLFVC